MKSDGLAGGEVVSEGSEDQRCHARENSLMLRVVNPRHHNAVLINYNMLQMHWEKTEKQDVFGHRRVYKYPRQRLHTTQIKVFDSH